MELKGEMKMNEKKVYLEKSKLPFYESDIRQEEYPLRIPPNPEKAVHLDITDLERIERFKKLYGGCVSDALHLNGIVDTVISHDLFPLDAHSVLVGRALPIKWHSLAPEVHLSEKEFKERQKKWDEEGTPQSRMHSAIKPGNVLVFDNGGDTQAAIFGEMSCNLAQSRGCVGVVNNGLTRDVRFVRKLKDFPYFSRGTSPNSYGGYRVLDVNIPVYLPGHLKHYVIVNPGDFIFGDDDGLQVIPEPYVDNVLLKAEEIFAFEEEERALIANGLPIEEVYKRFGDL